MTAVYKASAAKRMLKDMKPVLKDIEEQIQNSDNTSEQEDDRLNIIWTALINLQEDMEASIRNNDRPSLDQRIKNFME